MTQDPILSVRGLQIRFDLRGRTLHAIRDIDLDLYRGEVLALVGESGSGKSVFTKSFMGLLDANGSITGGSIDYYPTLILSFVTIAFYLIGNAFSDAADPKNHLQ